MLGKYLRIFNIFCLLIYIFAEYLCTDVSFFLGL